ncbi:XRE family transcriptional regulator, partial [Clostridioides difficile]|nr:XRE family transcriptional regulator [Clostridioides difficile]
MKINNNLKLQREKIGLTQLEVAQKAKITER